MSLIDKKPSIGSGNGLASKRRQATTWTNANLFYLRLYAELGGDELSYAYKRKLDVDSLSYPWLSFKNIDSSLATAGLFQFKQIKQTIIGVVGVSARWLCWWEICISVN